MFNLDAMYYCANKNNINNDITLDNNYHFYEGNTNDMKLINLILEKHNIEYVINFAAQSHVQDSFDDSIKYTYDNIVGTHTLLECCRKYGKNKKISSCIYR